MAVEIALTHDLVALVDDVDAGLIKKFVWHAQRDHDTWYARRNFRRADGVWTTQRLHTLLTGFDLVDHVDGNGLNNQRSNLRYAAVAQNNANRRKQPGTSRFKGVFWFKWRGNWRAQIRVAGRCIFLGSFRNEVQAALAYDAAARVHFGEFATLNFPEPGERSALVD